MKKIRKIVCILLMLMLCACNSVGTKQYISYTIYPIGYLLNRIGGNKINITTVQNNSMIQTATVVDNFEEIINDSFVLFHIGDLEPYMDAYEKEIKEADLDLIAGDLSILNCFYDYKRYTSVNVDGKVSFVEGPYYEGDVFNKIDTYDLDPFIWLSPSGMYSMAKDVYDYLSNNYFEQSAFFKENYEALADELIALDASYQTMANKLVKENKTIKFVSMSASFGCWQRDFNIQVYPVCLSKYGAMPSENELEIIKKRIINDDVKYIAYEPNMAEEMADLYKELSEELGLKQITLYNISSLTSTQVESGEDYISLMYKNLSVLENIAVSNIPEVSAEEETTGE